MATSQDIDRSLRDSSDGGTSLPRVSPFFVWDSDVSLSLRLLAIRAIQTNQTARAPSGIRLLQVEDNKNTARLLMDYLCIHEATVQHTCTRTEAMAEIGAYGFAMMDLRLPGKNGSMVMERHIRGLDKPPLISHERTLR